MALLDQSPQILLDSDRKLIIEESHFGRKAMIVVGVFLASLFVVPAIVAGIVSGSLLGVLISIILGCFIVGGPFLLVLAFSNYRRVEIGDSNEIIWTTFYQFRSPRRVVFPWGDIHRVVYQRRRDSQPHRLGRLRVFLHTVSGDQHVLLRGWHSEAIIDILRTSFRTHFEYTETQMPW